MPATSNVFQKLGATVTISASTTSADEAISCPEGTNALWVVNAGAVVVFVSTASGTALTATAANSVPIPAADGFMLACGPSHTVAAALAASSTATVYVTPGRAV